MFHFYNIMIINLYYLIRRSKTNRLNLSHYVWTYYSVYIMYLFNILGKLFTQTPENRIIIGFYFNYFSTYLCIILLLSTFDVNNVEGNEDNVSVSLD